MAGGSARAGCLSPVREPGTRARTVQRCPRRQLRLIAQVIEAAHRHGKWVGMCGEMAGDLNAVPLLLGLGLDEFSMAPASIPKVKRLVRSLSYDTCRKAALEALEAGTADEVRARMVSVIEANP